MKTISNIGELFSLDHALTMFIIESCPWLGESWEPESIGYIFVVDENDIERVTSVLTVPHFHHEDEDYQQQMTIHLPTFDLWESPAIFDATTGYWNAVAILGEEYGCTLFLSAAYVSSIPELHHRLAAICQRRP